MQNVQIAQPAARLRMAVFAAMAVIGLLYLAARFGFDAGGVRVDVRSDGVSGAAAAYVADGAMLLLLAALWRLSQMLRLIAAGDLFSAAVIGRFRAFAFWLLVMALFGFAAPIIVALLGIEAGTAHPLALVIDMRDLLTVGITLLLFLLARLLERARDLEAEVGQFV